MSAISFVDQAPGMARVIMLRRVLDQAGSTMGQLLAAVPPPAPAPSGTPRVAGVSGGRVDVYA